MGRGIEVICGCMSSGKTAELLERLARYEAAGARVLAIKHSVDNRYSAIDIVSRTGARRGARSVRTSGGIAEMSAGFDVVGIDEAQFFGIDLLTAVVGLANEERRVLVSGLDFDAWDRPFAPVPEIIAIADSVTVLTAACAVCGESAARTQRTVALTTEDSRRGRTRMVGGDDLYEPRCRTHFVPLRDP